MRTPSPHQLRSRRVIIRGRRGGVMNRRGFVAGLGSLAMAPALPAQESRRRAGRLKITEVRLVRLKVVRELGTLQPAWYAPGHTMNFQVGGGAFLELRTDQGLVGIGP